VGLEKRFSLKEVLRWAAEITGKGVNSNKEYLTDIVRETLEVLENEESVENLRKWCVCSCGCNFTVPNDMGQPLKYKLGKKVGPVRGKAYEFRGYERKDNCDAFSEDIKLLGEFPTFYEGPTDCPFRLSAVSIDPIPKGEERVVIVQAEDEGGKEITSVVVDEKTGEEKTILGIEVKIADTHTSPVYTERVVTKIKEVQIPDCDIRFNLMWVKADWGDLPKEFGLLGCYAPGEHRGCFRRYSINENLSEDCCYEVEILARLALPKFKFDNEVISGFDSSTIRSMIRAKHYQTENDINSATFNSNVAMANLKKSNQRKLKDVDDFQVFIPMSASKFPKVY